MGVPEGVPGASYERARRGWARLLLSTRRAPAACSRLPTGAFSLLRLGIRSRRRIWKRLERYTLSNHSARSFSFAGYRLKTLKTQRASRSDALRAAFLLLPRRSSKRYALRDLVRANAAT